MPSQLKAAELEVDVIPTVAGLAVAGDLHFLGREHPAWLCAHAHLVCACLYWDLRGAYARVNSNGSTSDNQQQEQQQKKKASLRIQSGTAVSAAPWAGNACQAQETMQVARAVKCSVGVERVRTSTA
jgi:hypothetical protein